jgi:RNA polymerase subunit RPABC4/transcription elongation factor Spt4
MKNNMKTKVLSEQSKLFLEELEGQSFIIEEGALKGCKVYHQSVRGWLEESLTEYGKHIPIKHTEEVIRDLLPEEERGSKYCKNCAEENLELWVEHCPHCGDRQFEEDDNGWNNCRQQIIDKAKERYNITIK